MVSITSAAQRVKGDPGAVLTRAGIDAACAQAGHRFRCRKLDPFLTIVAMVVQVMHGNAPLAHVVRLMHGAFNASAFCQARARLPVEVLAVLLGGMVGAVRELLARPDTPGRWRGLRTLLIDGTGFSMPDTPALAEYFGYPANQKPGCGFPVGHLVTLFDAGTGLVLEVVAAVGRAKDLTLAAFTRGWLRRGDLLIGDRAFCSYAHLAVLHALGVDGLFRLQQSRKDHRAVRRQHRRRRAHHRSEWVDEPTLVRRVSRHDRIVEWLRPKNVTRWLTPAQHRALPPALHVRVIHFRVTRPGWRTKKIVLATTLLDAARYPAEEIAELYLRRWAIELNFRHLKQTMGMNVLRCQSVAGVRKELAVFALVYNLVRLVMLDAGQRQEVAPDRISFVDALRWLQSAEPDEPLPKLKVNPLRPGRSEPRARKRRHSRLYPVLTHPRPVARRYLLRKPATLSE